MNIVWSSNGAVNTLENSHMVILLEKSNRITKNLYLWGGKQFQNSYEKIFVPMIKLLLSILLFLSLMSIDANGQAKLDKNELKIGRPVLSVLLKGYEPECNLLFDNMFCLVQDPLLGEQHLYSKIGEDGTLTYSMPLGTKYQTIRLVAKGVLNFPVLLSIDSVSTVVIDVQGLKETSPTLKNQHREFFYFEGANSDINNDIMKTFGLSPWDIPDYSNKNASLEEFRSFLLDIANSYCKTIEDSGMREKSKEYSKISIRAALAHKYMRHILISHNNLSKEAGIWSFLQNFNIGDEDMLYSFDYNQLLSDVGSALILRNSNEILNLMKNDGILDDNALHFLEIVSKHKKKLNDAEKLCAREFDEKYGDVYKSYETQRRKSILLDCLGDTLSIFMDIRRYKPLIWGYVESGFEDNLNELRKCNNQVYYDCAMMLRQQSAEQLEGKRSNYKSHLPNESEADAFIVDIIANSGGKVILIDLWNVWCAPCLKEIRDMGKYEKELRAQDVSFVYVANTSSPKEKHDELTENIEGQHYRISLSLFDALMSKFGLQGIPSFIIVDEKRRVFATQESEAENLVEMINTILRKG